MKKTWICLMTLCLLLLPAAGLAAQADLGRLALSVPEHLDLFTRRMQPDDPLLALYGTSAEQVARELSSKNLLMRAREISGAYTITLSEKSDAGPDFSALSDEELLAQKLSGQGNLDSEPILRSGQAAFLVFRGRSTLSLVTRVAGTLYRLKLHAEGRISGGMADSHRQMARSMDFGRGQ